MRGLRLVMAVLAMVLGVQGALAQTAAELEKQGFKPLFNGKDFSGWMNAGGGEVGKGWKVEDGAMSFKKSNGPGGDVWTKERFGDFVLTLEFKTTGNSGVFFRTDNPKDNVQTGIEIQVDNPAGPSKHSVGAAYDLLAPTKNMGKKDEWNKFVITALGPKVSIEVNGEKVVDMNLDDWKTAGKNPDGTANKFKTALKDFRREGHIGFQDHGADVAYRNVYIKAVKPE